MGSGGQIKTGAWDPEEDDLLYYWQSKVGNKWSEVAKHIPGRTGQQCAQRWRHKVNPNIRRDKWTADEDAKLIELVKTFGVGRWAEIARNCDGRTDQQCMGRWRRHLDPAIKRDSWTPEEDAKLRQLHAQYGTSWSRISKNLKGRTSQQCRARWHQINNTRSKSCGSGAAAAAGLPGLPAATAASSGGGSSGGGGGAGGGRQSGRRASTSKRRTSRRRNDSSCSEDDEEDELYDEDEEVDGDEEQGGSSGAQHSGAAAGYDHLQQQQQELQEQEYAAAVAAAAAAAGYGYGAAELQQPWVASLAAGMIHGALSNASDPAAHAAAVAQQQYEAAAHSQQGSGQGDEQEKEQDEQDEEGDEDGADDAADYDNRSGAAAGGAGAGGRSQSNPSALPRFKSLPSKLSGQQQAAGVASSAAAGSGSGAGGRRRGLQHTGSLPSNGRRAPPADSTCMSPSSHLWPGGSSQQQQQHFNGALTWSPSRLLLSPQRPEHHHGVMGRGVGRGGRHGGGAVHDISKDVNEEEAAGAETLLEMASLLRQESCELQPAQLPAYTPPKRPARDRLEEDLPEGLSPSPYKRARSNLFGPAAAAAADDSDGSGPDGDHHSRHHRRRHQHQHQHHRQRSDEDDAGCSGEGDESGGEGHAGRTMAHQRSSNRGGAAAGGEGGDLLEHDEPGPAQPSPSAAGVGRHHRRTGSMRHYRVPQQHSKAAAAASRRGDGEEEDDDDGSDGGPSHAFRGHGATAADEQQQGSLLGADGFRGAGGGLHHEQGGDGAAAAGGGGRPSNASSLTGLRGPDSSMAAAAAAVAAAVFMSPPPAVRSRLGGGAAGGGGGLPPPGSATTTPNRPPAQTSVMGLLASPLFERMVGCATPPSAGRTQPSAATLAALQSPQPSRVPEPFWTPFTGLFQDALFTRGTSATPDLPSDVKPRLPRLPRGLFSPAGPRSGSASGGKVASRRGLLRGDSPLGPAAHHLDTDDDKLGSQPSAGGSAERPSAAAAAGDGDSGPSPAAACGVNPPATQVHHRVVRRLDQHEAWGTARSSPNKHARSGSGGEGAGAGGKQGLADSGTGFSLFSPVKKQRVPLFNETSTIRVGATPSKPDAPDADQLLPIAPLRHNLPVPSSSIGVGSSTIQQQQQQQHSSPREKLAAAAASNFLHGRSPLGTKTRDRVGSAAAAGGAQWAAAPGTTAAQLQQQAQHDAQAVEQQHSAALDDEPPLRAVQLFRGADEQQGDVEEQQQQGAHDAEHQQQQQHGPAYSHPADAAADEAQLYQQQQQQQDDALPLSYAALASPPPLERAGSAGPRQAIIAYDEPDTPVNANMDTADNTSCSGTPNTPAGMRADATGGAHQMVSPNDYVTPPQHRLRASRPLAPLHKDCLIAAATRSLADGLAQQQQRQQQQQQQQQRKQRGGGGAGPSRAAASAATAAAAAASSAAAAPTATAAAAAASSGVAGGAAEGHDSPGQCSGDSSRILSCERLMDSPLEAAGLAHSSPSQWHQGMVAMLRSLQQTPLQPKGGAAATSGLQLPADAPGGAGLAADAAAAAAAGGGSAPDGSSPAGSAGGSVGIKVCSRALRRLQDELERGSAAMSAATAAIMAKQQQQQQQQSGELRASKQAPLHSHHQHNHQPGGAGGVALKDGDDAEVPFSASLSLAHAAAAAAAAASASAAAASCSTPMMLPLFTTPATTAAAGGTRLPTKAGPAGAAAPRNSTTPLALACPQGSSGVASVSLTPAVVTLRTPAASAAASAATPSMPAVAWPVHRSDGGLVVSAPMTGGGAGAGATAAAAAAGTLVQLTPAASSTKAAAATGATPFAAGVGAVGATPAAATAATGQQWASVVRIQPLTVLAGGCNAATAAAAAAHSAALQSVLALQPAAAGRNGNAAAATTPPGTGPGAVPASAAGVPGQLRSAGMAAGATSGAGLRDSSHAVRSRLHALIDSV